MTTCTSSWVFIINIPFLVHASPFLQMIYSFLESNLAIVGFSTLLPIELLFEVSYASTQLQSFSLYLPLVGQCGAPMILQSLGFLDLTPHMQYLSKSIFCYYQHLITNPFFCKRNKENVMQVTNFNKVQCMTGKPHGDGTISQVITSYLEGKHMAIGRCPKGGRNRTGWHSCWATLDNSSISHVITLQVEGKDIYKMRLEQEKKTKLNSQRHQVGLQKGEGPRSHNLQSQNNTSTQFLI